MSKGYRLFQFVDFDKHIVKFNVPQIKNIAILMTVQWRSNPTGFQKSFDVRCATDCKRYIIDNMSNLYQKQNDSIIDRIDMLEGFILKLRKDLK